VSKEVEIRTKGLAAGSGFHCKAPVKLHSW
jgi:hypothetical protein